MNGTLIDARYTMRIFRTVLIAIFVIAIATGDAFAQRPARHPDSIAQPDTPPGKMYGPRHGMMAPITEEEEQAALAFLRSVDPESAARVEALKESAPRWYSISLRRTLMAQMRLDEMATRDSSLYNRHCEIFRLDAQAEGLAIQYREAQNDADRTRIRAELVGVLDRLFDLREGDKRYEIERLEQRLERLRRVVDERAERKNEIVDRRADELIGARDSIEW